MTVVLQTTVPNSNDPVVVHSGPGDFWFLIGQLTFSGNYSANGEAALAEEIKNILKQLGTGTILWLDVQGDTAGFVFAYNYTTEKLQIYRTGTALKGKLEELPAGALPAEITGAKVRVFAIGR